MENKQIIAWDLGATKCCAGLVTYDQETDDLHCVRHCKVKLKETTSLLDLIQHLEQKLEFAHQDADCICIAGAGCYDGGTLLLENAYPYHMNFASVAHEQKWPRFDIIHDYAPIVCATFTSYMHKEGNVKKLNENPIQQYGRRVAFGIGTGLGMKDGVLLSNGDFWLGQNEVGHTGVTCPPTADPEYRKLHFEFMHYLERCEPQNAIITYENILTGQGTVNLYRFFYPDAAESTPEEVGINMREGKVPEMVNAFAWYIGLFAGTVQLTFMPEGGVWMTGGVSISHLDVFDLPAFQLGIAASPAYWAQRQRFPLGVLCNHEHALVGCAYYAIKRLMN